MMMMMMITLAAGDLGAWSRSEGALPARHVHPLLPLLARSRLQEVAAARLARDYVYERTHPGSRLVVDRVQAGLDPPRIAAPPRWTALTKHFNMRVCGCGALGPRVGRGGWHAQQ